MKTALFALSATASLGLSQAHAIPEQIPAKTPGLSAQGGLGLLSMPTAMGGPPWQFRVGLSLLGFAQSDYLIAGDRTTALSGTLTLDAMLGRHFEAWMTLSAASQTNERQERYRSDPVTINSLGDIGLGLKVRTLIGGLVDMGLQPHFHFTSGGRLTGPDASTFSPGADFLLSLDLKRVSRAPLRFHLLLGYFHDRSAVNLLESKCTSPMGQPTESVDECIHSRIVTASAYSLRQPRLRLGLGVDVPVQVGSKVAVAPVFEYQLEATAGEGDGEIRQYLGTRVDGDALDRRVAQWLTVGLRLHTAINLTLDLGLRGGLGHPGYAMGPPLPQLAGYGALTFAGDFVPGARRVVFPEPRKETPPPAEKAASPSPSQKLVQEGPGSLFAPRMGMVRGVVRQAATGQPIPGAVIKLNIRQGVSVLADPQGGFESCPALPGTVSVEATHPDYETSRTNVQIAEGKTTDVQLALSPKQPPLGTLRIDVVNDQGEPLVANVVLQQGGRQKDVPPDIAGGFMGQADEGGWTLRVESDGYFGKEEQVSLSRGENRHLRIVLGRRPPKASVRLTGDTITLLAKGGIQFAPGSVELLAASKQILDEIADLLRRTPEIRKLRIEGHTDNIGAPSVNQQVSLERAQAVQSYLETQGVHKGRLVSEGFGSSQPLSPNLTPQGRAKNRRVVFRIVERTPQAK